jgi:hypothetical protein
MCGHTVSAAIYAQRVEREVMQVHSIGQYSGQTGQGKTVNE